MTNDPVIFYCNECGKPFEKISDFSCNCPDCLFEYTGRVIGHDEMLGFFGDPT